MQTTERVSRNFRFNTEDLAEIDRRARDIGLNRTAYLIAAALDKLPGKAREDRLQAIEDRLDRVEAALYG